ncbi:MAG: 2-C-methyl-D-erythritol 4-phosphate cytidylyltransferase [Phycisphaerales bacterium]|nr:2-C-methyl-D-erythritol 4-phosphate cytidylyltransferase [Phycisphaerales bacterium]
MAAKVSVIVPGAGKGTRFGGAENKTMARLDGRPVFLRTLEHFINRDDVIQTILVVSGGDLEEVKSRFAPNLALMGVALVEGGERRVDSVAAGLKKVRDDADLVAIHDAVRPCVTAGMIDAVFAEAVKAGAAILASPLHGTLKRVSDAGVVDETMSRVGIYEAQTPQVFTRQKLLDIYAHLPEDLDAITDDAQLFELAGHPVSVVRSDPTNIKITTKADMVLANAILKARPSDRPTRSLGAFEEAQW